MTTTPMNNGQISIRKVHFNSKYIQPLVSFRSHEDNFQLLFSTIYHRKRIKESFWKISQLFDHIFIQNLQMKFRTGVSSLLFYVGVII